MSRCLFILTDSDYSKWQQPTGQVTLEEIDPLAKRSFPLCMRRMHNHLRSHHHLKHLGRMQYGLFLKGIGISLQDALVFWKTEFSKVCGADKFDRQYAYNIRHNYGKEGAAKNYTPYSCVKIIGAPNPTTSEAHGCPYKQDINQLERDMRAFNMSDVEQVMAFVREGNFQIACAKHFEMSHPGSLALTINHPNNYFAESMRFYGDAQKPNKDSSSSSSSSSSAPQTATKADNKTDKVDVPVPTDA